MIAMVVAIMIMATTTTLMIIVTMNTVIAKMTTVARMTLITTKAIKTLMTIVNMEEMGNNIMILLLIKEGPILSIMGKPTSPSNARSNTKDRGIINAKNRSPKIKKRPSTKM